MRVLVQDIVCMAWLALVVMAFVDLRKWNKKFSRLHDELERQIKDGDEDA